MNQTVVRLLLLIFFALGVLALLTISPPSESQLLSAKRYPEPRALKPFVLTDNKGQVFNNARLEGQWDLIFLGYTYCPDICPTTLAELRRVYPQLAEKIDVNVVFISVDPIRDTAERLDQYIGFFNSEFTAVTGIHKELFPMTRNMGMMYSIPPVEDNEKNYLINHSGAIIIINPEGQLVGRFPPEVIPGQLSLPNGDHIVHDLLILASE
jgi:protein SCO1/2